METSTRVTGGETTYIEVDSPDYLNIEGKTCSKEGCNHKAHAAFCWAPGHFSGFRCACCFRAMWEEALQGVQESLAGLPEGCDA